MHYLRLNLLLLALLTIPCLASRGQDVGPDGKYESMYRIPWDGKAYEIKTNASDVKARAIIGGILTGLGAYRKDETSVEGDSSLFILGNAIWIKGVLKRQLVLGIIVEPEAAPRKGAGDPIDYSFYRLLEAKLDDMLRVGRNLRGAGIEKEAKNVSFGSIQEFKLSVFKGANNADVVFYVEHQGKRTIYEGTLAQLNEFTVAVREAGKWLIQQRDTASLKPARSRSRKSGR